MKILAIDPGPQKSSSVFFYENCIQGHRLDTNNELLNYLRNNSPNFDVIVIEKIILYKRVGSEVGDTIFFSGRFYEASKAKRTELIPRITIRNYFCGRLGANDAGVKKALIKRFGKLKLSSHEWNALALAVYVADVKEIK